MVRCAVNVCTSTSENGRSETRFFQIPSLDEKNKKRCAAAVELVRKRRELWITSLNRADLRPEDVKTWMRVCSLHFISGKCSITTYVDAFESLFLTMF